jgi:hypothetical protein
MWKVINSEVTVGIETCQHAGKKEVRGGGGEDK